MSLSSLLVQRGVATIREVEEALARQVLYGGDLVTSLLELGRSDEVALLRVLSEAYGMPAVSPGELPRAEGDLRRAVPGTVAQARGLFPLSADRYGLVLAVAEPLRPEVEQALVTELGAPVAQRVALGVRIARAVTRDYGLPLDGRSARVLARLDAAAYPATAPSVQAPVPGPGGVGVAPVVVVPAPASSSSPRAASPSSPPSPPPPASSPDEPAPASPREGDAGDRAVPVQAHELGPRPRRGTLLGMPSFVRGGPAPGAPGRLARREAVKGRAPRRHGPLTAGAARAALDDADDRDRVLDLVFDFARQFFDFTALFVVSAGQAELRDAFGDGARRDDVAGLVVPLDEPSLLAAAYAAKAPLELVPDRSSLDLELVARLGRPQANVVVVVPVVVRRRVVAFLVGDPGPAPVEAQSVRETTAIAARGALAFERLILARKRGASADDAETEPAAPVAPAPDPAHRPITVPPPTVRVSAPPRLPSEPPPTVQEPRTVTRRGFPAAESSPGPPPAPGRAADAPPPPSPRPSPPPPPPPAKPPVPSVPPPVPVRAPPARASVPPPLVPESTQRIQVAAHRPPPRAATQVDVPSVILDVAPELAALVERVADGDEDAEAELVRAGSEAMPAIMERFPGPITVDASKVILGGLPRVADCGPVLRLIARQRRVAVPYVLGYVDSPQLEARFWATYLLTELQYAEAVGPAIERLFDAEQRVRHVARAAVRGLTEAYPVAAVEKLRSIAEDGRQAVARRALALDALGNIREVRAVPVLVRALAEPSAELATLARVALGNATRHDFGMDPTAWAAWWAENEGRTRMEWLLDALGGEAHHLRAQAAQELTALAREDFGYADEQSPRDRERVQARFRQWWAKVRRSRDRR